MMKLRSHVRGFTLMELLVAVLVASVLMVMVYQVYIRAAKSYRVQNMALEMQAQVRFGLEHVRRDVSNAGFNGTTNSTVDLNLCAKPAVPVRALRLETTSFELANPSENPNIKPISIVLFGDYSGNGEVFYTASVIGSTITLTPDFKNRVTKSEFDDMFAGGDKRYIRLVDKEQYELLLKVSSASYESSTINTVGTPPVRDAGQSCGVQGFGEGMEVNSAHFIRYRVARDTRPDAAPGKSDLVREELKNDGTTPVSNSKLIITENVVDLSVYDLVFDEDKLGTAPKLLPAGHHPVVTEQIIGSSGFGLLGKDSARVQDLRFLTIKLTVRTALEDPDLMHQKRTALNKPIRSFDILPALEGAARTMSMAAKVKLNTLAVRNMKSGLL
jgi:prepilin-type N-terminal cleavage/methylation domain-containing protein